MADSAQPVVQHLAWLARSFGRTDYLLLMPDDLEALDTAGAYVTKHPGTHLFREGEPSSAAYIIQRGRVELYRGDRNDRLVVARAGEGSVLGDIAMFRTEPYIQSARAVDQVTALRLDREKLEPYIAGSLASVLEERRQEVAVPRPPSLRLLDVLLFS